MKFAFDVDEVLRDTLEKMKSVYEKFFIEDYVYEEGEEKFDYEIVEPINSYDFQKHFRFPTEQDYINFLYFDFPMNICGHAPSISATTFNTLTDIQNNVLKKKDKLTIISKSIAKQKPSTLFFLSKYGTEVNEILFFNIKTQKNLWKKFDVIVTANPEILKEKPNNKISIKINTTYNSEYDSNFNIDSIEGFTSIYNQLNLKHVRSIR